MTWLACTPFCKCSGCFYAGKVLPFSRVHNGAYLGKSATIHKFSKVIADFQKVYICFHPRLSRGLNPCSACLKFTTWGIMSAQYLFQVKAYGKVGGDSPFLNKYTNLGSLNLSIVHHIRWSWALICATKSKIFNNSLIHPNLKIERYFFYSLYQFLRISFLSPCCCCTANYIQWVSIAERILIVRGSSC